MCSAGRDTSDGFSLIVFTQLSLERGFCRYFATPVNTNDNCATPVAGFRYFAIRVATLPPQARKLSRVILVVLGGVDDEVDEVVEESAEVAWKPYMVPYGLG